MLGLCTASASQSLKGVAVKDSGSLVPSSCAWLHSSPRSLHCKTTLWEPSSGASAKTPLWLGVKVGKLEGTFSSTLTQCSVLALIVLTPLPTLNPHESIKLQSLLFSAPSVRPSPLVPFRGRKWIREVSTSSGLAYHDKYVKAFCYLHFEFLS